MRKYLLFGFAVIFAFNTFGQKEDKKSKKNCDSSKTTSPCCCIEEASNCPEMSDAVVVKSISIDFKTKNIASNKIIRSVKKGDYVRIKVVNYNPMQYKVIINATDSSVSTPVDGSILTSLFDPTGLTAITSTLIDKTGTVSFPENAQKILFDKEKKQYADDGVTLIIKKCDPARRICPIVETECPTKDIVDKACLEKFYAKVSTLIMLETNDIVRLKKAIDKKLYEAIRKFSVQSELYPDCNTFKNVVTKEILSKLESEIERFADTLNIRIEKMNIDLNDYASAIAPYKEIIDKNNSLVVKDSLVKKFYAEALKVLNTYSGEVGYDKLVILMSKLEVLKLYRSCYVSLPIFVAEDVKKIDIEFRPRHDTLGLPNYNTTLILPPVQRRVWGVSSGIFVTSLKNEAYGVRTFTRTTAGVTDTLHNIEKEKGDNAQIGVSALAYTGWRLGNNANYLGACFGAGLSLESKPKPRVLLGVSFITGEKNRLMVSLGCVGGYVRRISSRFNTTTEYKPLPVDYTKDMMDFHGFLSFNYSFLSK